MKAQTTVTRIGAIFDPLTPIFLVEYQVGGKTFHQKTRIKHLKSDASPTCVATALIKHLPDYLGQEKVPYEQLCQMIQKIIDNLGDDLGDVKKKSTEQDEGNSSAGVEDKPLTFVASSESKGRAQLPKHRIPTERLRKLESFGDLNRVRPDELRRAKKEMDAEFEAARIKPGDEGFVFDKRQDFDDPELDSSWD